MKILFVEDDVPMQQLIKVYLEEAGYEIHMAGGAQQALRSFRSVFPDLVLLDIGLGDGNGFSVCRSIREEAGEGVPVIFLTARGDVRSRLEGFRAGAQDYMQKPVTHEELIARIGIHLRSKKAVEDLTRRNSELELRERVRRDMTDMIVHDLKAPLSSIQATLDIIKAQGLVSNAQYEWMIDISRGATGMMLLMINNILDIAQAEQGELRPEIAPVDLSALLEQVSSFFKVTCESHGIRFETKLLKRDSDPYTDPQLLFRVLANLAFNAIKFSPKGGEVLVEFVQKMDTLRLAVYDRGPGVSDPDKQRIFDKFIQLSRQGQPLDRGSGIGLAFCRFAAKALGGRIWVEDRKGGGSCFVLELPNALHAVMV